MNGLSVALWAEVLKFRRSKAPWLSALVFSIIPLAFGFFMLLLGNPELASRLGILTMKAQMTIRAADWPSYFGLLAEATAAGFAVAEGVNGTLELTAERAIDRPDDVARLLVQAGVPPTRLSLEQDDLETHFLKLVGVEAQAGAGKEGTR